MNLYYYCFPKIFLLFFIFYISCNNGTTAINPSPTDKVVITDINRYIADSDIIKADNYVSSVKLSHKTHEDAGIKCIKCHHKNNNDERVKQCAYCHKGNKGEDQLHNFCINCHLDKKHGPTMCQKCHVTEN